MWTPYDGQDYVDVDAVDAFCRAVAAAHPRWVSLEVVGQSRQGRPIHVLTLGDHDGDPGSKPAFWIDGGTHAVEWTGVMACLFAVSRWVEGALDGSLSEWLKTHTIYCLPCVSPDGVQAVFDGAPFMRSALRPPKPGTVRTGFEPRDVDGDGAIRWMRWKHPGGSFIADPDQPLFMRPRRLDDDPADAWVLCSEGELLNWDGVRWTAAPLEFGVDMNRNFPDAWRPFAMFGMDGGAYALSEPESRALVVAFAARPHVAAALTNHTYTGALLTAPSRADDPLSDADVRLMEILAEQACETTSYRVIKKHPTFQYDPKNPIAGCWDDTLTNTFGVAGYTLELWDPFAYAGIDNPNPVEFFRKPDHDKIKALIAKFAEDPGAITPWRPFDHPQLGAVEIGGIDYLRTVRNPPVTQLKRECERGFHVAETIRKSLPDVRATLTTTPVGQGARRVRLVLENRGFLGTAGLQRAEAIGACPPVSATLELSEGQTLLDGTADRALSHVDGWGENQLGFKSNSIYARLPARGQRTHCDWLVGGDGPLTARWRAGRGGKGTTGPASR